MRILLVGEYSNFHNSLKAGLTDLGHEVLLISDNDFKAYPVDVSLYAKYTRDNYLLNKIRQAIFRLFKTDIAQWEVAWNFYRSREKIKDFDVVQLVNEYAIQSTPALDKKILSYIFKNNGPAFLVSAGDDFVNVNYMLDGKMKYSVLTPCEEFPNASHCKFTLRYVSKPFEKLHNFVYQNIKAVVAGDMDYYLPLKGHSKCAGLIPYPINLSEHDYQQSPISDRIIIFHGINEVNYYKKGNYYFERALEIIEQQFGDRVEIITTRSVPYSEYIRSYERCHILLDQVFSYDQGYNALEAMARGKVVFTGAETEFIEHYGLTDRVAINALPDVDAIVAELNFLLNNPQEIQNIKRNARAFVEKEHDYILIAQKYLALWSATR